MLKIAFFTKSSFVNRTVLLQSIVIVKNFVLWQLFLNKRNSPIHDNISGINLRNFPTLSMPNSLICLFAFISAEPCAHTFPLQLLHEIDAVNQCYNVPPLLIRPRLPCSGFLRFRHQTKASVASKNLLFMRNSFFLFAKPEIFNGSW